MSETKTETRPFSAVDFYAARDAFNAIDGASINAWQKAVDWAQANGFEVECGGGLPGQAVASATLKKDGKAVSDGKPKPAPAPEPVPAKAEDKLLKK